MADESSEPVAGLTCPICGGPAEAGHLVGEGPTIKWVQGEPGFWKDTFRRDIVFSAKGIFSWLTYPTVRGIHCPTCRRIILET